MSTIGWAQSYQGGMRGQVTDGGGAALVNAKITAIDEGTNQSLSTITTESGEYVFNRLNPANYSLIVETAGFKKYERKGITIATQQFLTIDVKMEVGDLTTTVNVTEEVPLLNTSDASTGQVLDNQKLVDLPNLGRNPFMMSKISTNVMPLGNPGFSRMQDQSGSSAISVAGGPIRGNNYLIDGVPITDSFNRAVIIPSIEAVQEVKVQANTYDAEMGRTGGGTFNTYMKSGTNQLHGSAFGSMRETEWTANSFFANRNGIARGGNMNRTYAASLGGPVFIPKVYDGRNKTFWNLAFEGYYMTSSYGAEFNVPTAAEIGGNFSGRTNTPIIYDPATGAVVNGTFQRSAFPGNIIPTNRLSQVGSNIARTYVAPNVGCATWGCNNFASNANLNDRAHQITGKFDQQITSKWRASLSYLRYKSLEPGENNFATISSPNQWTLLRQVDATQLNNTYTVTPTLVVTARYGFNRFPNTNSVRSLGFDLASLGFSPSFVASATQPMFPVITMESLQSLGTNNRTYEVYHSRNLMLGASKYLGRHNLKFGYDWRRINVDGIQFNRASGAFNFDRRFTSLNAGTTGGTDLASLLLGAPAAAVIDLGSQLGNYVTYTAGYFHDDFRVSNKLTVNMGLRYEWETGIFGRDNSFASGFDPNIASPLRSTVPLKGAYIYAGTPGYRDHALNPNKNKFSPRIGAAYQLDSKTVLRGGYSLFWAPVLFGLQSTVGFAQTTEAVTTNDVFRTPNTSLANPFPNGILQPRGKSEGLLAGTGRSIDTFSYDARSPYLHQYSFDVQRQLGGGFVGTLGYVGSTGRNLINGSAGLNINQLDPQFFGRTDLSDTVPNPFFQSGGTGLVGTANISRNQLLRPFPQFQSVTIQRDDTNRSQYHSLTMKGEKQYKNGFMLVANYTWAKQMDMNTGGAVTNFFNAAGTIQNVYDLESEYAWSNFIAPHRVNITTTYELPFGKGKAFASGASTPLNYLIGGWSLNVVSFFQSGFPLALSQNTNLNSPFGAPGQRPSAAPNVEPGLTGTGKQGVDYGYLNPNGFLSTPRGQFGNLSRTINVLGPGQMNWDMSMFKTFGFGENNRYKAQFRAEAVNAFNSVILRGPNTALGNPNFGRSTAQANFPRFVQLALRITF